MSLDVGRLDDARRRRRLEHASAIPLDERRSGRRRGPGRCCTWTTSAALALVGQLARGQLASRRTRSSVGMPRSFSASSATLRGGLDAQHGNAGLLVILEQVAVVARDLDDQALRPELAGLGERRRRASRRAGASRRRTTRNRAYSRNNVSGGTDLGDLHERARRAEARDRAGTSARVRRVGRPESGALASGVTSEDEDRLEAAWPHDRQAGGSGRSHFACSPETRGTRRRCGSGPRRA